MNIKKITSLDVIGFIENAAEVVRLKQYKSKDFIQKHLGLGLSRAGFYGILYTENEVKSIARTLTIFNSPFDVNILIEGIVILNKIPVNEGAGLISYSGYGLLEVNNVVIYDGRLANAGGGGGSLVVNHSGDVTGTTVLTIAPDAVDNSQLENMASGTIKGRENPGIGDPQDLSDASVRAIINVEDGATADQTAAEIKIAYESNANTNEFSDAEQTKLGAISGTNTGDQNTDLGIAGSSNTTITVTSSTGTNVIIPAATASTAGLLTSLKLNKLDGIEYLAEVNPTDGEIETSYNSQVSEVTQAEAEAGTVTTVKRWTPERVKQAIDALAGGTPSLTNGEVFVGNSSNAANSVPMTGDVAIAVNGATTIQPDSVTYDKMQDVSQAAMLGNTLTTGGTVEEIPIVQQYLTTGTNTALLDQTSNWDVNGEYKTGSTSLTNTYQGQAWYNVNYWFTAIDDNVWIRLIRG